MKTQCPHCGGKFSTLNKHKDKQVKCPKCKQIFKISPLNDYEQTETCSVKVSQPIQEKRTFEESPSDSNNIKSKRKHIGIWDWIKICVAVGLGLTITLWIILRINMPQSHTFQILDGIVDSLAECFYNFLTTNPTIKIVLLIVNIPVFFILAKIIFGDLNHWWRHGKYRYISMYHIMLLPISRKKREVMRRDYSDRNQVRKEFWLHMLHCWLWIALYFLQYLLIKIIFLG
jgi:predicted Zn finger-like uncharacterized protein